MPHPLGTRVVIGLAIAAALGLADVVGLFAPDPELGEAPPWALTLVIGAAGVVTLVAAAVAFLAPSVERWWRPAGRVAAWLVVGSRAVSVLANIPVTFRNGATVPLVAWSAVVVVATVVAIVLVVVGTVREPVGTPGAEPPTAR